MLFSSPLIFTESFGHRDGCHRWHSCPSDNGSYVCGDLGNDSECGSSSNGEDDDSSDNGNNSDNKKQQSNDKISKSDNSDFGFNFGSLFNENHKKNNNNNSNTTNSNAISKYSSCIGTAHCFTGKVTKVVDGDTLDVDKTRIRLALVNTPEINQQGYAEAKDFVKSTCDIGSRALVDEDDGQTKGSYGRMIGLVYCNDNHVSLNQLLLDSGHAKILENICKRSEFANQQWAQSYGCNNR